MDLFWLQWICLVPVIAGSLYAILCLWAFRVFLARKRHEEASPEKRWPPVTILKPVCGIEKKLKENLLSACLQDYPEFQVVFSISDPGDPALAIVQELQQKYPDFTSVVVQAHRLGSNRKINNLAGALSQARHNIIVISDSDVRLPSGYLKKITAPLDEHQIGFVCTLYRAVDAGNWFEKMEALTLNADFTPAIVFAAVTGASPFCLGASVALQRRDLEKSGGLKRYADYLGEDYALGNGIRELGKAGFLSDLVVDTTIDLPDFARWWRHQVTWDQKTKAARPFAFAATILIRAVPFAFFFLILRSGDWLGWAVLASTLGIRLGTAAAILGWALQAPYLLRDLIYLPLRDLAALPIWAVALAKPTVVWRGNKFRMGRKGRIVRDTI